MSNRPLRLTLSGQQKGTAFVHEKSRDKEEYRRAYAIKQKMERGAIRTIAKDMGVDYRSV